MGAGHSFDNPDFVDVVIHSYRRRLNNAPGEPRFLEMERQIAQRPKISAPVITLYGAADGIARPAAENPNERNQLPKLVARRVIPGAGHFLPREKPEAVEINGLARLVVNLKHTITQLS